MLGTVARLKLKIKSDTAASNIQTQIRNAAQLGFSIDIILWNSVIMTDNSNSVQRGQFEESHTGTIEHTITRWFKN